jgi:hypothetical protein
MPIPTRRKGERRNDFVSRCMGDSIMNREYPDKKKRAAICNTQADKQSTNATHQNYRGYILPP